jgi:transposase-like protein
MEGLPPHEGRAEQTGPWDPKLQTPESRKALVDYAKQHGIKPAMRHFSCSRNTIRKWLRRFEKEGEAGLKGLPRGRKPKSAKTVAPAQQAAPQYPWPSRPEKPSEPQRQTPSGNQPASGHSSGSAAPGLGGNRPTGWGSGR